MLGEYLARHEVLLARRARLDALIAEQAHDRRWAALVGRLRRMRGIDTLTAVGLIAEIGDFTAFAHPKQPASFLGLVATGSASGEKRNHGSITKAGSGHARRLLIEAAWHYRHAPRRAASGPEVDERAWQAQVRLHHRHRHLTQHGKRPTVANVAVARELVGFLWAAMTDQPLRSTDTAAPPPSITDHLQEATA